MSDDDASPSQKRTRPRKPQWRATNRPLASPGFHPDLTARKDGLLPDADLERIIATLPLCLDHDEVVRALQDVASSYDRWLDQPTQSRAESNYDLRVLGHEAATGAKADALRPLLNRIHSDGRNYLWVTVSNRLKTSVDAAERYLQSNSIDWTLIGEAADAAADLQGKGGDYPNPNLGLAVQQLVDVFEMATGGKATWSSSDTGSIGRKGTQATIVTSDAGKFVLAFFESESLRTKFAPLPSLISNSLKAYLEARSQVEKMDLHNLSHSDEV